MLGILPLRALIRALALMLVVALCLVVSADSAAAPCPDCPELPPQPQVLVCPSEKALKGVGLTREEEPSEKVGKIADAFSVSSTGEAVYSVSLNVPPGRLGMEPHLALSYSSGSGEGPFGMGFGLTGLSSINRCASNYSHDHRIRGVRYDSEDNLCLDGLRLVQVPVTPSGHSAYGDPSSEYRTFPDTFRRVRAFATAGLAKGPQFFTVETKSGRTLEYGHDVAPGASFNGRVMGKDGLVRAWAVTLERDRHGNTITYSYRNDRQVPGDGHTITHVPLRIDYTGSTASAVPATHAVVFDTFDYIQHARAYTGGMLTNHSPAVSRIRMLGPGDAPVRLYNLTWNTGENGRSRIEMIQECAGAGFTDCRPPTRLGWLDQPGNGFTEVDTGISYPAPPTQQPYTILDDTSVFGIGVPLSELDPSYKWLLADVTGDGLSDLVVSQTEWVDFFSVATHWKVGRNVGTNLGALDTWRETEAPLAFESSFSGSLGHQAYDIVPMDVNDDGRVDLMYYDPSLPNYDPPLLPGNRVHVLTPAGQPGASKFDPPQLGSVEVAAPLPGEAYSSSGVLYADMNGDGKLDAITCENNAPFQINNHSTGTWRLHLWNPDVNGFTSTVDHPDDGDIPIDLERGCYLRKYIHVVDVDGDGKAELLIPPKGYAREESTELGVGGYFQLPPQCVAPCEYQAIQRDHDRNNRSLVNWREYNTKLPAPDWSVGDGRVLFPDVNGDGLPDAVMPNPPGWALAAPDRLVTFLNTGDGFDPAGFLSLSSPLNFVSSSTESEYLEFSATIDYDGDGQTDILVPMRAEECSPAFDTWSCWAILKADPSGDGHLMFVPTKIPFAGSNRDIGIPRLVALGKDFAPFRQALIPRVADMNGDGRQDIVIPMDGTFKLFLNEGPVNLLHAVTDGMNPLLPPDLNTPPEAGFLPNITIEYGSLVDHATTLGIDQDSAAARNDTYLPRSNLDQPLGDCDYPRTCVVGPRRVVKSYELNNGQNQPREFSMRYRNGRADRLGRGFLGFGTVITTDEDGHSGHADLYDTATRDATVFNKSPELLQPFSIDTFPYAGQVATSLSWVLGLPEVPGLPSLPVARMHFVDFGTSKNFGSPKPRLLVPTNDKTTYFTLAQQTETRDVEAAYLAADADKPLPDFVMYYGGGATYNGGALVPYGTAANVVYKVLETDTTSTILGFDETFGSILKTSSATIDKTSSPTIDVDDHRTVTRTVDNDVLTWRLGEVTNETVCSKVIQLQSSSRCVATDAKYDGSGDVYVETTSGGDPQVSTPLPLQTTTTYTRDLFGNLTNIAAYDHIAGHQREACVGYDSDGMFPVVFGNAAGHFTYVNYNQLLSTPTVAEDPNGLTTTWRHDSFGRTVLETRPDGTTTVSTIKRLKDGGPDATWWALHTKTDSPMLGQGGADLDSLGRTVLSWTIAPTAASVTALGDSGVHSTAGSLSRIEQIVGYDFRGRMTTVSKPYLLGDSMGAAFFTTYEYDNLGRALAVKAPWKAKTTYSYQGNSVTVSAPGTSSTTVKDARGRTTSIVDGLNHATTYTYAHFGGLRTVSPPGNTPTTTDRDAFGRVIHETDPDRGETKIGYDGFGERTGVVDGEHTESYDYDMLGRMVAKLDDVGQTTWSYDDPQKGLGRLSEVVNPAGITKSYTYYGLGTASSIGKVHTVQLTADADSLTTTLDYDMSGRLAAITSPPSLGQQFKVLREYDIYGHLVRVKDGVDEKSAPYWELRQINGVGQTTEEWMNGGTLTTSRSYDPEKSTLDHILTTGGAAKVQDLGYTYDDRLNMKSRVDGLQLVVGAPLGEHFLHDALDRLTCSWVDSTCHPGPGVTCPCDQQVTYKDNGNIDKKSGTGTYAYDPDHPHAVQFVDNQAYGYDKVGNQTSRPDMTVDYTPFDLPARYKRDGVETLLEYDGDQTRVRKTVKYDETLYFGDYERLTHLGSPSTVEHRYSVRSNERVVAIVTRKSQEPAGSSGKRTYVHVDHLGSTEKVTDAAGVILERRSYDAFGAKRNPDWTKTTAPLASTTMAGYTGHEDDEDLGLVNMKGRIYDPRIARFLTTDPLVSYPGFSQSWNPYSYVMNSPLKFIDPTGFDPDPELVKIYGPGVADTVEVVGQRIPDRDPSVDAQSRRESDQVKQAGDKDAGAPQQDPVVDNDHSFSHLMGNYGKAFARSYGGGVAGTVVDTYATVMTLGMWSGGKVIFHVVKGAVGGGAGGALRAYAEGLPIVSEGLAIHDSLEAHPWSTSTPGQNATTLGDVTIPTVSLGATVIGIGAGLIKGSPARPALDGNSWSPAEVGERAKLWNSTYGEVVTRISPNQMRAEIARGAGPRGIIRVDSPKVPGEQLHAHFTNDTALSVDGTWKHDGNSQSVPTITAAQRAWLTRGGWTLP